MINNILRKYKALFLYLFFGVCTTIINVVVYMLCYQLIGISNIISTSIAWLISVIAAYISNKLWVFESRSFVGKLLLKEVISFFSCRIITGFADVAIMYVAVDIFTANSTIWKILSNIIVVVSNYFASKFIIFSKK